MGKDDVAIPCRYLCVGMVFKIIGCVTPKSGASQCCDDVHHKNLLCRLIWGTLGRCVTGILGCQCPIK